jgi:hypothetical protein
MKTPVNHSRFPVRKCLIASAVIIVCAVMALGVLYGIANQAKIPDKSWIFALVWAIVFGAMLLGYWIFQIVHYIKNRKDENSKEN